VTAGAPSARADGTATPAPTWARSGATVGAVTDGATQKSVPGERRETPLGADDGSWVGSVQQRDTATRTRQGCPGQA